MTDTMTLSSPTAIATIVDRRNDPEDATEDASTKSTRFDTAADRPMSTAPLISRPVPRQPFRRRSVARS